MEEMVPRKESVKAKLRSALGAGTRERTGILREQRYPLPVEKSLVQHAQRSFGQRTKMMRGDDSILDKARRRTIEKSNDTPVGANRGGKSKPRNRVGIAATNSGQTSRLFRVKNRRIGGSKGCSRQEAPWCQGRCSFSDTPQVFGGLKPFIVLIPANFLQQDFQPV
jgi:hypothetical protein